MIPKDTLTDEARIRVLKEALMKAIITLEDTRKAFKSKRLEGLRLELMKVLGEI